MPLKCYLEKRGSKEVRALAMDAGRVACCAFGKVELAATIHRNLSEEKISAAKSRIIWKQFDLDESSSLWTWLEISPEHLAEVMQQMRELKPSVFIRAADALHLACAREYEFKEIYSNDRHLLAAAAAFKIKGCNIIP